MGRHLERPRTFLGPGLWGRGERSHSRLCPGVLGRHQLEAPSVPSETGSCASLHLTAPSPQAAERAGTPGVREPRVPVLPRPFCHPEQQLVRAFLPSFSTAFLRCNSHPMKPAASSEAWHPHLCPPVTVAEL